MAQAMRADGEGAWSDDLVTCRERAKPFSPSPSPRQYMDVAPGQIVSVAASLFRSSSMTTRTAR